VFNSIDVTELRPPCAVPHPGAAQQGRRPGAFDEGPFLATSIRNAELVPIDGSNHALMGDEPGWEQVVRAIDAFLPARGHPSSSGPVGHLTPRQLEILELVAQACANAQRRRRPACGRARDGGVHRSGA
jgi:hypothetical protein